MPTLTEGCVAETDNIRQKATSKLQLLYWFPDFTQKGKPQLRITFLLLHHAEDKNRPGPVFTNKIIRRMPSESTPCN